MFSFSDSLLAEAGGVPQRSLHTDLEAISEAYSAVKPLAKRLGVEAPVPKLAGFSYAHLAALGCEISFEGLEPTVSPLFRSPAAIDDLREPEDYLESEIIQQRIKLCKKLHKRYPRSPKNYIGALLEGPVTTAVMIMGSQFLVLPYDDPDRAHRLLKFCTQSAINYANAIREYFGTPIKPKPQGLCDDFAGMFPPAMFNEFVVPYWEETYQGLKATRRSLHSELLRVEHLPYLEQLKIRTFDPSADQYLTPALLHEYCPCEFECRILSWHIRDSAEERMEKIYRDIAKYNPRRIRFSMTSLRQEPR